jgi:hypothetical protein
MRYQVLAGLLLVLLLAACAKQEPVCSAPYLLSEGRCCLDADSDGACDQKAVEQLDCSLCPPQFVTEKKEVIVYRYVCINESVVDTPQECGPASNAKLFKPSRQQNDSYIEDFSADAACRGKFSVAEVHIEYIEPPTGMTLQVLYDPEGQFQDVAQLPPKETYYYIGFCKDCQSLVDMTLEPDQAYLVRAVLHYKNFDIYTREELIDPTPTGEIGRKAC